MNGWRMLEHVGTPVGTSTRQTSVWEHLWGQNPNWKRSLCGSDSSQRYCGSARGEGRCVRMLDCISVLMHRAMMSLQLQSQRKRLKCFQTCGRFSGSPNVLSFVQWAHWWRCITSIYNMYRIRQLYLWSGERRLQSMSVKPSPKDHFLLPSQ